MVLAVQKAFIMEIDVALSRHPNLGQFGFNSKNIWSSISKHGNESQKQTSYAVFHGVLFFHLKVSFEKVVLFFIFVLLM